MNVAEIIRRIPSLSRARGVELLVLSAPFCALGFAYAGVVIPPIKNAVVAINSGVVTVVCSQGNLFAFCLSQIEQLDYFWHQLVFLHVSTIAGILAMLVVLVLMKRKSSESEHVGSLFILLIKWVFYVSFSWGYFYYWPQHNFLMAKIVLAFISASCLNFFRLQYLYFANGIDKLRAD